MRPSVGHDLSSHQFGRLEATARRRPLLVSEQSCLPVERDEQLPPPSEESAGNSSPPPLPPRARPLATQACAASISENSWIAQRVPAGHSHAYVLANANESLSVLCRLLRERFNQTVDEVRCEWLRVNRNLPQHLSSPQATTAPPRVVIFTKSADSAIEVANRLQVPRVGSV